MSNIDDARFILNFRCKILQFQKICQYAIVRVLYYQFPLISKCVYVLYVIVFLLCIVSTGERTYIRT